MGLEVWKLGKGSAVAAVLFSCLLPGVRSFKHGWKRADQMQLSGCLPRRIPNHGIIRQIFLGWRSYRLQYARSARGPQKLATVQAPTEVP